ncbi:MAG: hypothetical protein K2Y05_10450 [Hyphomicrobiaceae bacterium]|nr:hypothetical protein [Hyphomicrobiaceae bacterium]
MHLSSSTKHRASDLFLTPKSIAAVPVPDEATREFLRQASLDPTVRHIDYVGDVAIGRVRYPLNSIIIVKDGERRVVDLIDRSPLRTLDDEGMRLIALEKLGAQSMPLTDASIMSGHRCAHARRIWEDRRGRVSLITRDRLLEQIGSEGAVPLGMIGSKYAPDVFELACEAEIEIDISVSELADATVRVSSTHVGSRRWIPPQVRVRT